MQWSFQLCNVILTPTWEKSHEDKNIILTNVSFPLKTSALLEVSANHFIMSIISTINTGLNEVLSSGAGWSHRLTCFQSILLKIFNWSKNEFLILQKVSLSHKMQWQYKRNYWLLQSKHCLWSYLLQTQHSRRACFVLLETGARYLCQHSIQKVISAFGSHKHLVLLQITKEY